MIIPTNELRAAYNNLPRPVREYLVSTEFAELVQQLGNQHGLHIDTIGNLSRTTGYLLCGLINPPQFQSELQAMGINPSDVSAIIQELNDKVFKPLQEKMRNTPPEETPAAEPEDAPIAPRPQTPPPAPRTPSAPLVPPPRVVMQPPPPKPAHQPMRISEPPRPVELPASATRAETARPAPVAVPVPPPPVPRPPQPTKPPVNEGLHEVLKNYGVDPYREVPE